MNAPTAVEMLTTGLAAIAAAFSAWAALSAHRQVRYDQDSAGGRGISFDVQVDSQPLSDGKIVANCLVRLELFGPGKRYQAELSLVRPGGFYVRSLGERLERNEAPDGVMKQAWKVLTCTDDPVTLDFSVTPASALDGIWCLFTWIDPRGEEVWTGAFARRMSDPAVLYEWRWYRTRGIRKRIQQWGAASRGRQWVWHRFAAKPRPLGKWRVHSEGMLRDRQGPVGNLDTLE